MRRCSQATLTLFENILITLSTIHTHHDLEKLHVAFADRTMPSSQVMAGVGQQAGDIAGSDVARGEATVRRGLTGGP